MTTNSSGTASARAAAKAATNGDGSEHAEAAKASMVDQLAEDANPPALPEGAPALTPYLKLPYRKRGDFMKKMATVREMAPTQKSARANVRKAGKGEIDLAEVGGYYHLLAELDELLHLAAEDPAELEAWQANHGDDEFVELYNAYMRWSQAGEASSSAS